MKLVLKKNHHHEGKLYLAGETIDLPKADYDYVMSTYMAERGQQVEAEAKAAATLASIGILTPEQVSEAKAIGKKV